MCMTFHIRKRFVCLLILLELVVIFVSIWAFSSQVEKTSTLHYEVTIKDDEKMLGDHYCKGHSGWHSEMH